MADARPDAAGISRILTLVFTDLADATRLRLLHEARQLYAAIGAPKRAERLLPEIRR
jgi:hypothetical protein